KKTFFMRSNSAAGSGCKPQLSLSHRVGQISEDLADALEQPAFCRRIRRCFGQNRLPGEAGRHVGGRASRPPRRRSFGPGLTSAVPEDRLRTGIPRHIELQYRRRQQCQITPALDELEYPDRVQRCVLSEL